MIHQPAILVTGGTGYIGSHTIVDLINSGFRVVSIDNHIRSRPETIQRIESITGQQIVNYAVDLCNKEEVRKVLRQVKTVSGIIHFAALKSVPESVSQPIQYYRNNINSLLNLLELTCEFSVKNFVFSSSCSVYGNTTQLPVTEETPFGDAESPYARSKQMCEQIITDFSKTTDTRFILLRYFNPVGAHETGLLGEDTTDAITAMVPRITGTAIGKYPQFKVFGNDYPTRDGSCIRDYIHVMDIANAHTKALQYLEANPADECICRAPEVFNLGTGNGVTVLEAIQSFEKVSGQKLNYVLAERRAGDVVSIYANNTKAREVLGWQVARDLDKMMLTAWMWEQKLKSNSDFQ